MTTQIKTTAVLYHANCPDGFTGAWVARKKFGDSAVYIPVKHNEAYPEEIHGLDVVMVDFCYPKDITEEIQKNVKSLTVIDHHISNKDVVLSVENNLFDNNHSGAVLAWKYFFPDENIPKILAYVEDNDLWNFELAKSKEINSAISSYDFESEIWDSIISECETNTGFEKYVKEGVVLLRKLEKTVQIGVERSEEIEFEGYRCLVSNSSTAVSHIGNALVKKMPPIGIIWSRVEGKIIVSLRSDGTVDVSEIAKKYGGGGHKCASGFSIKQNYFLDFLIK